jgi:molybdopterin-guanine dinucleotide biosynthesis protein A
MSPSTRSAAILAGGLATRFGGRDKGALLVDGRAILDRQIAELAPLTTDLLIVGGHDVARPFPASAREEDRRATARLAVAPEARRRQGRVREAESPAPQPVAAPRFVADIVPECGPLGGLHAALTEARGDALFVVACDMPYVTSAFIAYLLSLAGDADIVLPQSERGYHPLCAVYTRACLEPVAARLADRRLKMRELVAGLRARVVPVEDIRRFGDPDRLLTNVNTPAEYAGLDALQGHKL